MGTRKKKRPEFELPAVIIEAIQEYLGPSTVNKLTAEQARKLMEIGVDTAGAIGAVLETTDADPSA